MIQGLTVNNINSSLKLSQEGFNNRTVLNWVKFWDSGKVQKTVLLQGYEILEAKKDRSSFVEVIGPAYSAAELFELIFSTKIELTIKHHNNNFTILILDYAIGARNEQLPDALADIAIKLKRKGLI